MIRTSAQPSLGTTTAPFAPLRMTGARRTVTFSLTRSVRHVRALLRITRRRPALGLILAAGAALTTAGTALTTSGTALSHSPLLHRTVDPLAPAPHAPPAPPASFLPRQHRLVADLGKINPLRGLASWYGDVWNGRTTASGEPFDETKLTAAHKTLPLGTIVRVTNLDSMRSVVVKINDRGTLAPHRVIDLSSAAARELGMLENGLAHVKLEVLGKT